MAVRESLLNTITSVASSDFVRLVTSAGESSKATVANLFKSFESGLGSKSSLGTGDYIRVVGSDNVSYKQLVSDVAKTIIENYTGSSLAGLSQSVKSTLDSLNSKTTRSAISFNVDSTKISNPTSIQGFRVGNVVVITCWRTKFTSGGTLSNAITGVPTAGVSATAFLAPGGGSSYDIQGNFYLSSGGNSVSFGLKTAYVAETELFGTLIYLAQY